MNNYDHKNIEKKWQDKWESDGIYNVSDKSDGKDNFYQLVEFSYPSGNLHVGHWYAFSVPDIFARYKRMQGFNVLYPMGFDAFGLPAENAAIKLGADPKVWTIEQMEKMRIQLRTMGAMFPWDREVVTCDPEYYRWTQWMFNQFLKNDLVYRAITKVNWCPKDQTILANEQVVDNKCERCGTEVIQRDQPQWMLRITKYADRLIDDLDKLDWPSAIKDSQKNWIGRSEGSEISFKLKVESLNKTKVILLHGCPDDEEREMNPETRSYDKHWLPWVKQELENKGIEVVKLSMPEPWNPTFEIWREEFEKLGIDENTILIGHSCGNAFFTRWLGETKRKVKGLIMVAPWKTPDEEYEGNKREFYEFDFDPSVKERVGSIVIFSSDDEDEQGIIDQKSYHQAFGGQFVVLPNHGHYTKGDMGTEEFPELLEKINEIISPQIKVFTTRADTLFGVTYVVLAPEHKILESLKDKISNWDEVEKYIADTKKKSELDRQQSKEKTGVELKGIKAINPANGEEVPVWIAHYVLAGYGTGAVMAVPAHDERDFEFAKKYDLPKRQVIARETGEKRQNEEFKNGGAGVVFDPVSQKYAIADLGGGKSLLFAGGVSEGEDVEECVMREIIEESGLHNFKYVEKIETSYAHYFNTLKKVNRVARAECYLVILENTETLPVALEEHEKFVLAWKDAKEIKDWWVRNDDEDGFKHYIRFLDEAVARAIELGYDTTSSPDEFKSSPMTQSGVLEYSGQFTGLISEEAKQKITEFVGGKMVKTYRLRDWGISRQRYWGCPIPIVYDPEGNAHAVPDEHLPWLLPTDVDHTPDGTAPLARSKELFERTEKIFGEGWRPEVETMDTFVDSSWYFYRYLDNKNDKEFSAIEKMDAWMPIDLYMGGAEHTTMHLLYSRFWTKALYDLGFVKDQEAYKVRRNRGLILGPDGEKMSKSRGNVINPDEIVERLGADTVRLYLAFMGPYGNTANYPWDPNGVVGVRRFIERVWKLKEKVDPEKKVCRTDALVHKTIKGVTEDVEEFKFNTAIAKMMILLNALEKEEKVVLGSYKTLLKLLAPFAPHIAEELWSLVSESTSIHLSDWPKHDEKMVIDDVVTIGIQINGKVRDEIEVTQDDTEESLKEKVLDREKVKNWIGDSEVKKFIYIKGRLVSIVC